MKLGSLLKDMEITVWHGDLSCEIKGIAYDSRKVKPGYLFVCIKGFKTDGHLFAQSAVDNGAVAILGETKLDLIGNVTQVIIPDCRQALPILAARFYGQPSRDLRIIGVTGTNGKTTTTHFIRAILEEWGKRTAIMGTLYAKIDDYQHELGHTTPESLEIEEFFAITRQKKGEYVVMEVSSHALDLNRVDEILFDVAVFTNLTQDHLDYHQTMEKYKQAKLKLFRKIPEGSKNFVIINSDDESARDFINAASSRVCTYGIDNPADVRATGVNTNLKGTSFNVEYGGEVLSIRMKPIGLFSVYNALAAIAFALQEGIAPAIIKQALEKVEGVPGRFEQVDCGQDFTVIVDYAHTPDGLQNILATARKLVENRLITVFGCGGDRDRSKRPLMGEIAATYSDFCIITSDNPRSEDPLAIINEIVPGVDRVKDSRYSIIADRREAIRHAIFLARPGDLIIIAGKGHETYQLVKDQVLDFDDRKIAAEFLKGKGV
ncbi:MAG: UDP-N-acetylmuramoyl-L-alanyl-D-glutamate--2,6-diaminopimelate ligase [Syntrophomonadaceae bacterium]|jgi:UDP-N-acetylmuramoyl-L-alanyl-D-glutamate--2,6-diaminopimelate ligase